MISHILRELILPPSSLLMLLVVSFALRNARPRLAAGLFWLGFGLFYALSVPLVAVPLLRSAERCPPLSLREARDFAPQAIVVLGGGANLDAPEYGGRSVPSRSALIRIAYAQYLGRELKLPILTTGGFGDTVEDTEGMTAARYLQENGFPHKVLVEARSQTTRENALFSKELAESEGIRRVLLVTTATHALRGLRVFEKAGFEARVAPTEFRDVRPWERGILWVIPTYSHFYDSGEALRAHLAVLHDSLRG